MFIFGGLSRILQLKNLELNKYFVIADALWFRGSAVLTFIAERAYVVAYTGNDVLPQSGSVGAVSTLTDVKNDGQKPSFGGGGFLSDASQEGDAEAGNVDIHCCSSADLLNRAVAMTPQPYRREENCSELLMKSMRKDTTFALGGDRAEHATIAVDLLGLSGFLCSLSLDLGDQEMSWNKLCRAGARALAILPCQVGFAWDEGKFTRERMPELLRVDSNAICLSVVRECRMATSAFAKMVFELWKFLDIPSLCDSSSCSSSSAPALPDSSD